MDAVAKSVFRGASKDKEKGSTCGSSLEELGIAVEDLPEKLRSLEEVRQKDILRLLAADEKNKGIVSEVLRRLVTDVRDEVLRSAEAGLKGTAETLKETAGSLYQAGQKALEKRK